MLARQTYEPFRFDATFTEREKRFQREKQSIGAKAATLIADSEIIGLTAGTTTIQVARALRGRKGVRVLTNADPSVEERGRGSGGEWVGVDQNDAAGIDGVDHLVIAEHKPPGGGIGQCVRCRRRPR